MLLNFDQFQYSFFRNFTIKYNFLCLFSYFYKEFMYLKKLFKFKLGWLLVNYFKIVQNSGINN